ncbi:DUF1800 domain-containing protein [Catellatospora tritici]|uniref:DUF1800 domain-containing protein n=1 Tax=Catellatospora tritici TaxID=2851566 RepID=UPI001C2D7B8A|nr:DUF1800 domain-containing protein [Catellatospora tritici]MBV1850711.1 DUF1800 domain-containing protein [Catellatospora tritici]MBV1850964.1 DUF1800 domain-containing protein [Catellatospora tritici]
MADRNLAAHLLRRATFGPTAAEIDAAAGRAYRDVVADLVTPVGPDAAQPLPVFAEDPYFGRTEKLTREQRAAARRAAREQLTRLSEAWLARMARTDHRLAEKLVFFWHGHWATSAQKVQSATLMGRQLQTFRVYGRGDFAVFAKAMLRDPALILWLDGQRNTVKGPNENLARELMELFTLGVGAYTEKDVKAAARALTGWTLDRARGAAVFQANRHAKGDQTVVGGTAHDADSLVDVLLAQPEHPVFLASRLWFRFGSGEPLPETTRDAMVAAYGVGRDVSAMLTAMLLDERFMAARGQLVKQPVEWAVGALRQLGVAPTGKSATALLNGIRRMGQVPLRPPSVGGWPSGAAWLTTSSLQTRMKAAAALAAAVPEPNLAALAKGNADAKVDAVGRLLAVDAWTARTRAALVEAAARPPRLVTLALISPEYAVH